MSSRLVLPRSIGSRESFIFVNELDGDFDFIAFILDVLEHDAAWIVGISLEMWCLLILGVLSSPFLGEQGMPAVPL
jgi:hypothetical protein